MKAFSIMEVMLGVSEKMRADFTFITSQVTHSGTKGEGREDIVKRFLTDYLPKNLGVGSGLVIDSTGRPSLQQDVVIYDISKCPILYNMGGSQIFPVEGVYAVIEVKSNLDGAELNDCIEKILSVKNLKKTEFFKPGGPIEDKYTLYGKEFQFFPILGYAFAFNSIELGNLTAQLLKQNQERRLPIENRIDVICVLNKGLVFSSHEKDIISLPEPNSYLCWAENENSLLLFYLLLMAIISQARTNPINLIKYSPIPGITFTIVGKN
jgi:hypothetical protein